MLCPKAFEKLLKEGSDGTLDSIFTVLAWSFNHLQLCIWPKADWNGRAYPAGSEKARRGGLPLANGFFAVICALIGDLDYLNKTLNLPHWQKISNPCAICKVGQNEWQNFKVDAEWTSLAWRPHEWKHWNGRSKSCLFEVNGLSAAAVHCDWLHAKYLGHDQYCLGSVIYLLVHYLLPEASPQGNLKRFWSWLQAWYRNHQTRDRYGSFATMTMFTNKNGIKLKGKGAQIRSLSHALMDCWYEFYNPQVYMHKMVMLYLKLNFKVENLVEENQGQMAFRFLAYFIIWFNF